MEEFKFAPEGGFRDKTAFPDPATEEITRDQFQQIPDQIKNYLNNTIYPVVSNVSNPNLLINSDFRHCHQTVVNQRRQASYSYNGKRTYTIDRWALFGEGSTIHCQEDGILFIKTGGTYCGFMQPFETLMKSDKGFALSCEITGLKGDVLLVVNNSTNDTSVASMSIANGVNILIIPPNTVFNEVYFYTEQDLTFKIKWVKLEQGSIATPLTPQLYNEELPKCQRYCKVFSGNCYALHNALVVSSTKLLWNSPTFDMRDIYSVVFSTSSILISNNVNKPSTNRKIIGVTLEHNAGLLIEIDNAHSMVEGSVCSIVLGSSKGTITIDAEIY